MPPSVAVFADAEVGLHCTQWLIENHKSDLANVVTTSQNEIYRLAESNGVNAHVFKDDASYLQFCNNKEAGHD